MLKIYNVKDKQEYLKEVATLTQKEWGKTCNAQAEFNQKIFRKIVEILFQTSYNESVLERS